MDCRMSRKQICDLKRRKQLSAHKPLWFDAVCQEKRTFIVAAQTNQAVHAFLRRSIGRPLGKLGVCTSGSKRPCF
eukprot:1159504-Pelagomonas_calceolata.AAC.2